MADTVWADRLPGAGAADHAAPEAGAGARSG